jgi:hypothetical protein
LAYEATGNILEMDMICLLVSYNLSKNKCLWCNNFNEC